MTTSKAPTEYGISWDVFKTRKWQLFAMLPGGDTQTLGVFDTRAQANAALSVLNKTRRNSDHIESV